MLYLTSLSYIDFVSYVYFKTKHNLYLNGHSLNACFIVLHLSWLSTEDFFEEKKPVSVKSIQDLEDSFPDRSL